MAPSHHQRFKRPRPLRRDGERSPLHFGRQPVLEFLENRSLLSGMTEYPIPTSSSGPEGIVAGPDGALWFTERSANKIGRISVAGVVTEYTVPTASSQPQSINTGPDGALWFTELSGDKIGRITTAGVITEYAVPTAGAVPDVITTGPDGALWFTEFNKGKIGRVTTAGVFTEYATSAVNTQPTDITAGPDGALWFTNANTGTIGRITTAGVETEFPTTQSNSKPITITVGADGALWFVESNLGIIGRMTTAGVLTSYSPALVGGASLYDITAGPDGNLWYTVNGSSPQANVIGQITTAGVSTFFTIPTPQSKPQVITTGPDGAIWFTEQNANNIARLPIAIPPTVLTVDTISDVSDGTTSSIAALLANKGSDGRISLREAIQAIGNSPATGTPFQINFAIPGAGVHTINVTSPLPTITQSVLLDATTQPGYTNAPLIEINGVGTVLGTNGLEVNAASTTIEGFSIYGFSGNAIQVDAVASTVIQSNLLGLFANGAVAPPNGTGLVLSRATGALVGGLNVGDGNVISGNGTGGIRIEAGASGNRIEGNLIGTNLAGNAALGNTGYGIEILDSSSNTIGGLSYPYGNRISGNSGPGVLISGATSTLNVIEANFIGTDITGSLALANSGNGVEITGSSNNTVGGPSAGAGNIISGNRLSGVKISGVGATGNLVTGNYIGTGVSGNTLLGNIENGVIITTNGNTVGGTGAGAGNIISGNGLNGIKLSGAGNNQIQGNYIGVGVNTTIALANGAFGVNIANRSLSNTVGGLSAGAGNIIADNRGTGVGIDSTSSNTGIPGNSIFGNGGLGIDLDNDGVTANSGIHNLTLANNGMNSPVFTSVILVGGMLNVSGYVGSAANHLAFAFARVDVFLSDNDPSRHGQGKVHLGNVSTDLFGNFGGSFAVSGLAGGALVTGTATDFFNNTSEFSLNATVVLSSSTTVLSTSNATRVYGQSVTFTATVSGAVGTPTGTVRFLDGTTVLSTVSLSGGTATFTTTSLPAGADVISVQYSGDGQYVSGTSVPITETVTPAGLSISITSLTKVYGSPAPWPLTIVIGGLVNGDTTAVLSGNPNNPGSPTSGVGTYTITKGALTAGPNYTISFTTGTLTVTAATLTVTANPLSKSYGAALPTLTYTSSGLVNGDTSSVFTGALTTSATNGSGVGGYPINRGTFSAGPNYTIAYTTGTLTVTAATLTVTANPLSKSYGAAFPTLN